jgi:hypothetical protein
MQEFLRTELASPNPDVAVFREFGSNHVAIAPGALERTGSDGPAGRTPSRTDAAKVAATPVETRELSTRQPDRSPPATPAPASASEPAVAASHSSPQAPLTTRALEATLERSPPEIGVAEEISIPPSSTTTSDQALSDMPASRFITSTDVGGKCRYCSGLLPEGRRIVFCPHCGQNLTVHRCPACSTELEMGWKFCVTCGRSAAAAP